MSRRVKIGRLKTKKAPRFSLSTRHSAISRACNCARARAANRYFVSYKYRQFQSFVQTVHAIDVSAIIKFREITQFPYQYINSRRMENKFERAYSVQFGKHFDVSYSTFSPCRFNRPYFIQCRWYPKKASRRTTVFPLRLSRRVTKHLHEPTTRNPVIAATRTTVQTRDIH